MKINKAELSYIIELLGYETSHYLSEVNRLKEELLWYTDPKLIKNTKKILKESDKAYKKAKDLLTKIKQMILDLK